MSILGLLCAASLGIGYALARWTRMTPLVIALMLALLGAVAATLLAAEQMGEAAPVAGAMVAVVVATLSGMTAFLGSRQRNDLEKK